MTKSKPVVTIVMGPDAARLELDGRPLTLPNGRDLDPAPRMQGLPPGDADYSFGVVALTAVVGALGGLIEFDTSAVEGGEETKPDRPGAAAGNCSQEAWLGFTFARPQDPGGKGES